MATVKPESNTVEIIGTIIFVLSLISLTFII